MFNFGGLSWRAFNWFIYFWASVVRKVVAIMGFYNSLYATCFFYGLWLVLSVNISYINKSGTYLFLLCLYVTSAVVYYLVLYSERPLNLVVSMVPGSVSVFLAGVVCLLETVSFLFRPLVVHLRIMVNVLGGGVGLVCTFNALDYWAPLAESGVSCWDLVIFFCMFPSLLLFSSYELAVGGLHWFIVKTLHDIETVLAERM